MSRGRMLLLGLALVLLSILSILGDGVAPPGSDGPDPEAAADVPWEGTERSPERSAPASELAVGPEDSLDPEREQAQGERIESETRLLRVGGTVRDRSGRPLPGIELSIVRPGYRGIGGTVLAHQLSDREGHFSLQAPKGEELVLDAISEEHHQQRIRVRPGGAGEHDLVLLALETTELAGRLLDPSGQPLPLRDLHRLFPELDLDDSLAADLPEGRLSPGPPFDQLSRLVFFSARGPARSGGQQAVEIDPVTARFQARVDGRFDGALALVFRGQEIERRPWRSGDPEVLLTVDVEALFSALGRIEIEVLDADSGEPLVDPEVEVIRESRLPGRARDTERLGAGFARPLTLEEVPPGRYLIVARARGYGSSSLTVEVEAGGSAPGQLRLSKPASVRVFLRFPAEVEVLAEQLDFSYLDQNNAEHPIVVVGLDLGERLAAQVDSVPAGRGAFRFDDSILRVDLKAGENPDLEWELRPVADYSVRVQLFPSPYVELDRWVDGWLAQFEPGGFRVGGRRLQALEVDRNGWVTLEGSTATGRYRWLIDFGELRQIDTRLTIGAGASNSFQFRLP